ncbi:TetR family transcriptional regulator [Rubrivivax gelatinosus]|uniref:TetR family transcriptional regulator n=1 Tax=Rubrivivax gelatinosus TaxID=28068 RepID=A0ABS1DZK3_RUBGE|nr:TetR family transcriptional regulator [Rubrivivax gelatinosus]MBK1615923.1 TetR family transcriptional regulator [Rubrivivax gelatinosus]MBK1714948.1 TetR family transcriptional regulator [Rubrivivax gelatinosus]
MARRTKEEAEATRSRILDAAESEFQDHGVSGTSLEDIARTAGVTRGAIYWHFRDKGALFEAMMDRVVLPLETEMLRAGDPDITEPLLQVRQATMGALRAAVDDGQARRVLEIALHKVEYVDEMKGVRERRIACLVDRIQQLAAIFERAQAAGHIRLALPAVTAALGLHALLDGLLHNWMLDTQAFDLVGTGEALVDAYFRGLQATTPA